MTTLPMPLLHTRVPPASANAEEDTMSVFYRILYRVGFTPWEEGLAQRPVTEAPEFNARRYHGSIGTRCATAAAAPY